MAIDVGLFGCGTIGSAIAAAIGDGTVDARLVGVFDRHEDRVASVVDAVGGAAEVARVGDPAALAADADLVVEAAGQGAVEAVAVPTLNRGCDLMLLSVGALADESLRDAVTDAARRGPARVFVPSGAIAGLDAVRAAAAAGGLEAVSLTTTKPPAGLEGAAYVVDHDIDLASIDEPRTVFEGPATTAASAFPENINVALALSLAGVGPDRTTVRIVADPDAETNVHHIEAHGPVGEFDLAVRNVPSPTNPKTSYLAPLSAIETIRRLTAPVCVGT